MKLDSHQSPLCHSGKISGLMVGYLLWKTNHIFKLIRFFTIYCFINSSVCLGKFKTKLFCLSWHVKYFTVIQPWKSFHSDVFWAFGFRWFMFPCPLVKMVKLDSFVYLLVTYVWIFLLEIQSCFKVYCFSTSYHEFSPPSPSPSSSSHHIKGWLNFFPDTLF